MQKMGAHRLLERKSPRFESDGCAVAPPKEVEVCVPQHVQPYFRRSQQTPQRFHPKRVQIGAGQNQN